MNAVAIIAAARPVDALIGRLRIEKAGRAGDSAIVLSYFYAAPFRL
ncbi:hypothetical protein [Bradyrhizobium sp. 27S5]